MLKAFEICEKIKNFTVISDVCHQNIEGKIVMFVTSFCFSHKIRGYSSQKLNYTEVLHSTSVMVSTVTRPSCFKGDFKATWCAVVDKL